MRPSRLVVAAFAGMLMASSLTGCGGSFEVVAERPLPETEKPKGIIIFPAAVMIPGSTPLEYASRANDMANWLLARTELPVVGPFDYKVYRLPDELRVASTSTNLMTRARDRIDIKGWLALRLMITENRAHNTRDIVDMRKNSKKKGQVYRQRAVEATVRLELELFEAMRGKRLAQIVIKDVDDPSALSPDGDPRPHVQKMIFKAMSMLFAEQAALLDATPRRRVRKGFVPSVPALASYSIPGKPSFLDKHKDKDDTDRQAAMMGLWDRYKPGLPTKAVYVAGKHHGLLALDARDPIQKHDVVMMVGGKKVFLPHQLDRYLQQCGQAGCEVTVRRGFKDLKLQVNWRPTEKLEMSPDEEDKDE